MFSHGQIANMSVTCLDVVSALTAWTDANKALRHDYVYASFMASPHGQIANMSLQSNNKYSETSLSKGRDVRDRCQGTVKIEKFNWRDKIVIVYRCHRRWS